MSYIINKTDGTVLTEIIDGILDQTATDLTLLGKNANSYGEFMNENFVHMLENFANTTSPNNPIIGQLWFDKTENRLKVYDGYGFKVTGGTIVSATVPSSISQGDLWIDIVRQQLYFNDGIGTQLAGPIYTSAQGITGFNVEEIVDINNVAHVVAILYISRTLIGILSKDSFTPASSIPGYSGDINIGFNTGTLTGIKFHATATRAEALIDTSGNVLSSDSFLSSANDSTTSGIISIQNSTPLKLGNSSQTEIQVNNTSFTISSNVINQNVKIDLINSEGLLNALTINASSKRFGLYTNNPTATLDVNGDVVIQGSLNVKGNVTTLNTTNLEIKDKVIAISKTDTPSNVTADGSGISVVAGVEVDKTLTWSLSTNSWTSSEHFNLVSGKSYKINGAEVLTYTTLGTTVTSAPGLTSIGTLNSIQVSNININQGTISYQNSQQADGTIILAPKGDGTLSINGKRISELANPQNSTDAVNLQTLTNTVKIAPLAIYLDTSGLTNSQIAVIYLSKIYPASEHINDAICRVVCNNSGTITVKEYMLANGIWVYQTDI